MEEETLKEKLIKIKKKGYSTASFKIKTNRRPVYNHFGLDGIILAWEKFTPIILDRNRGSVDWVYQDFEDYIKGIDYSVKDIEEFTKTLKEVSNDDMVKNYYLGLYISALINVKIRKLDEIVLQILKPKLSIDYLGAFLPQGTIIVEGNVGSSFGYKGQGGKSLAKGNSLYRTGNSNFGSSIEIEGKSKDDTAYTMFGGNLKLANVEGIVGSNMKGGKVFIERSKDKILIARSLKGGEIYKGNRLIYPK